MSTKLQKVVFASAVLQRGFWLYVWKVNTVDRKKLFYVGRTGDSSSLNAQSPFSRVSGHLGSNKNSNALRRHLKTRNLSPGSCRSFELYAFGPIYGEADSVSAHNERRDKIAALEKALCDELKVRFGDRVLNSVNCKKKLDRKKWSQVRRGFASLLK